MTDVPGDAGASRRDIVARSPVTLSALWWPVVLSVLGAAFAVAAISASVGRNPYPWWVDAPTHAVGLVFLAASVFVWTRQPGNRRMGGLMLAVGITYYLGALQFTGNPLLLRLGFWLYHVNVIVLAHLLLAYPDGRLTRRVERLTVAALYAVTVTTQGLRMLTEKPLEPQGWGAPRAPLSVWAPIGSVLGIALTAVVVVLVVQRWRAEPGPARRARGLFWAAVILIGVVVVAISVANLVHASVAVQGTLLLGYAVAQLLLGGSVVIGALRTHMAHERVTRFLAHIEPRGGGGGSLRDALAEALEDPTLTLHYPRADSDEYVDSHGSPAPLPTGTDRAVTWVTGPAGQPLAALAHDPYLGQQPHARQRLEAVVAAASLALENARLHAENRAHLRGILDIELATRQRIRAMLHDGPQHRLSGIQLLVGQLRRQSGSGTETTLKRIIQELQEAVQDLRDVTEGVYPSILRAKGLEDALDSLAQRSPVPLVIEVAPGRWPEHLEETVFFLITEAVGNAHKHAGASQISVRVWQAGQRLIVQVRDDGKGGAAPNTTGSGLRGMRDRVAAHDGNLTIDSLPGAGTTIEAELPCV